MGGPGATESSDGPGRGRRDGDADVPALLRTPGPRAFVADFASLRVIDPTGGNGSASTRPAAVPARSEPMPHPSTHPVTPRDHSGRLPALQGRRTTPWDPMPVPRTRRTGGWRRRPGWWQQSAGPHPSCSSMVAGPTVTPSTLSRPHGITSCSSSVACRNSGNADTRVSRCSGVGPVFPWNSVANASISAAGCATGSLSGSGPPPAPSRPPPVSCPERSSGIRNARCQGICGSTRSLWHT